VPCAAIRNYCIKCFKEGRSIDEVVKLIRRWLVIVDITKIEKKKLDEKPHPLMDKMPDGWDMDNGCIYDRLHKKEIKFDAPEGFPCTCKA
jgi:hypothetical protein